MNLAMRVMCKIYLIYSNYIIDKQQYYAIYYIVIYVYVHAQNLLRQFRVQCNISIIADTYFEISIGIFVLKITCQLIVTRKLRKIRDQVALPPKRHIGHDKVNWMPFMDPKN